MHEAVNFGTTTTSRGLEVVLLYLSDTIQNTIKEVLNSNTYWLDPKKPPIGKDFFVVKGNALNYNIFYKEQRYEILYNSARKLMKEKHLSFNEAFLKAETKYKDWWE